MFEAIVLSIVSGLIAACTFSSKGCGMSFFAKFSGSARKAKTSATLAGQATASETSGSSVSYLEQLQREIEETLFPRPTDSVLRRHYDTLVAVEVKNRLSFFS